MGRSGRGGPRGMRPVEKAEVSDKHLLLRLVLFAVAIAVAAVCFTQALSALLSPAGGWQEIKATGREMSLGDELNLYYELGASGQSPTAERKQLSVLYTQACVDAYRLFAETETFDGVQNLAQVNLHPGEVVTVDPALYSALERVTSLGGRALYLAPLYADSLALGFSQSDEEAREVDPYLSAEAKAYLAEIWPCVQAEEHVRLELLGECQVRLHLSGDYRALAEAYGVTDYVGFGWLKNAFAVDYVAEVLQAQGLTNGVVSSYDGFSRSLGTKGAPCALTVYDWQSGAAVQAAQARYGGRVSAVYLRAFPLSQQDAGHYYTYRDGTIRVPYLSPADGLCRAAAPCLAVFSREASCAEIALTLWPIFAADTLDAQALQAAQAQGLTLLTLENGEPRITENDFITLMIPER